VALLNREAVWLEGARIRGLADQKNNPDAAAWMDAHRAEITAGWKEGFAVRAEDLTDDLLKLRYAAPLTRDSLLAKMQPSGPIIKDLEPEPEPAPPSEYHRPKPPEPPQEQKKLWF
jgi:hypothetical protein